MSNCNTPNCECKGGSNPPVCNCGCGAGRVPRDTAELRIKRVCLELSHTLRDLTEADKRLMLRIVGNLRDIADRSRIVACNHAGNFRGVCGTCGEPVSISDTINSGLADAARRING